MERGFVLTVVLILTVAMFAGMQQPPEKITAKASFLLCDGKDLTCKETEGKNSNECDFPDFSGDSRQEKIKLCKLEVERVSKEKCGISLGDTLCNERENTLECKNHCSAQNTAQYICTIADNQGMPQRKFGELNCWTEGTTYVCVTSCKVTRYCNCQVIINQQ